MLPTIVPQPSSTVENPHSVYGGAATTINFVNRLEFESAKVFWIDFSGNPSLFAAIAPGNSLSQSTYVGHPWEVAVSRRDETIKVIYFAIASESNAIIDKSLFPIMTLPAIQPSDTPNLLSVQGGVSTAIEFDNRLQVEVKVYWLNFYGKKVLFATIPPGQCNRQVTFVGHPWLVVAQNDGAPLAIFFPAPYEGTAIIDSSLLSGGGGFR